MICSKVRPEAHGSRAGGMGTGSRPSQSSFPRSVYHRFEFGPEEHERRNVFLPESSSFRPWEVAKTVADFKMMTAFSELQVYNPQALKFFLHQVFLMRKDRDATVEDLADPGRNGCFYVNNGQEAIFYLRHCSTILPWIDTWLDQQEEQLLGITEGHFVQIFQAGEGTAGVQLLMA